MMMGNLKKKKKSYLPDWIRHRLALGKMEKKKLQQLFNWCVLLNIDIQAIPCA